MNELFLITLSLVLIFLGWLLSHLGKLHADCEHEIETNKVHYTWRG